MISINKSQLFYAAVDKDGELLSRGYTGRKLFDNIGQAKSCATTNAGVGLPVYIVKFVPGDPILHSAPYLESDGNGGVNKNSKLKF